MLSFLRFCFLIHYTRIITVPTLLLWGLNPVQSLSTVCGRCNILVTLPVLLPPQPLASSNLSLDSSGHRIQLWKDACWHSKGAGPTGFIYHGEGGSSGSQGISVSRCKDVWLSSPRQDLSPVLYKSSSDQGTSSYPKDNLSTEGPEEDIYLSMDPFYPTDTVSVYWVLSRLKVGFSMPVHSLATEDQTWRALRAFLL